MSEEQRSTGSLLEFASYKSDPLAAFVIERLRLNPKTFAYAIFALVALTYGIVFVAMTLMSETYSPQGGFLFLFAVLYSLSLPVALTAVPVIAAFYLWVNTFPGKLFGKLKQAGALLLDEQKEAKLIEQLQVAYGRQRWPAIGFSLSSIGIATFYSYLITSELIKFKFGTKPGWFIDLMEPLSSELDMGYVVSAPVVLLLCYLISMAIIRIFQTLASISLAFQIGSVVVGPLRPDKCGGLGALNEFLTRCTYILIICGFGLGLLTLGSILRGAYTYDYGLYFMIFIYLILVPAFYYRALGKTHTAMKMYKNGLLEPISNRYQQAQNEITLLLSRSHTQLDLGRLKDLNEQLQHLEGTYKRLDALPTWPFNTKSLGRIISGISISFIPTGISLGIRLLDVLRG